MSGRKEYLQVHVKPIPGDDGDVINNAFSLVGFKENLASNFLVRNITWPIVRCGPGQFRFWICCGLYRYEQKDFL